MTECVWKKLSDSIVKFILEQNWLSAPVHVSRYVYFVALMSYGPVAAPISVHPRSSFRF